jgi:hypothetical protein
MKAIKRKNYKSGQALLEYMLVVALMVTALVWGFSILKCNLYSFWVTTACDVFYPYPASKAPDLKRVVCDVSVVDCQTNSKPID